MLTVFSDMDRNRALHRTFTVQNLFVLPSVVVANMGGGANFDRLYHKLKRLLLLRCNYTMQFIGYNSIKTR